MPKKISSDQIDTTRGFVLPTWTTAGRPANPVNGAMGFNSNTGIIEWYSNSYSQWYNITLVPSANVEYLVVAGGGGGGGNPAGGGGAGGSGVVIISYVSSSQKAAGGTVTSYTSGSNTYWVHTFTSSGTFTA